MARVIIRRSSDLGLALATARKDRGLTQEQLAEALNLDRSYLARMEAGLTTVLLDRVLRVLRRLGAELIVELPEPVTPGSGSGGTTAS